TVETIHQCLGTLVFGEEEDELQHAVLRLLAEKGKTLGLIEWGSGGQIAQWLRELPGSEQYLRAGIVIGDLPTAMRLFDRELAQAAEQPPHSRAITEMLASAGRQRLNAEYVLAIGPYPTEASIAEDDRYHVALATASGILHEAPRLV